MIKVELICHFLSLDVIKSSKSFPVDKCFVIPSGCVISLPFMRELDYLLGIHPGHSLWGN